MGWVYLITAILFEVSGTVSMKLSEGFSKTVPSVSMFVFYLLSLTALTFALKKFEVSIAYAIWAGLGTALISVIGILYFKEPMTLVKIGSIVLIIIGVAGLHLGSEA